MKQKNKEILAKTQNQIKQPYKKPELLKLGDIRDVTMGGSPGFGDSGGATPQDPF